MKNYSNIIQTKIKRYAVKQEDIKNFLFNHSLLQVCCMAENTLMNHVLENEITDAEIDKIIDIIAYGLAMKSLSIKQQYCLVAFTLYFMERATDNTQLEELDDMYGYYPEEDEVGDR